MACSLCGESGHNKRTCIARKIDEMGIVGKAKEAIIKHLADEVAEELLLEMIETGCDCAIPGLGLTIKLSRYAWRALR